MGERWQRCYILIPVSEYFLAKDLHACSNYKEFPKGILYDYSCPSVDQDMVEWQMCSHCGLYFPTLKAKSLHFTGLVAESLKIVLKTQQSVWDHCELLPVAKGSCYVWWHFKRWSRPWSIRLMRKILISRIVLTIKWKWIRYSSLWYWWSRSNVVWWNWGLSILTLFC